MPLQGARSMDDKSERVDLASLRHCHCLVYYIPTSKSRAFERGTYSRMHIKQCHLLLSTLQPGSTIGHLSSFVSLSGDSRTVLIRKSPAPYSECNYAEQRNITPPIANPQKSHVTSKCTCMSMRASNAMQFSSALLSSAHNRIFKT